MAAIFTNAFRLLLMVVFCLATLPAKVEGRCNAIPTAQACGCCPVGEAGCCSIGEKEAPAPAAPMQQSQSQQQLRDALTPAAPVVVMLPPANEVRFPIPTPAVVVGKSGHSRQSVLCVMTV